MQIKYIAVAAALLAAIVSGAESNVFSGSGSDAESNDMPSPKGMMFSNPQYPDAGQFVHYLYTDASRKQIRRHTLKSNEYNPSMVFGGASIANREDGMSLAGWDMTFVMTEQTFTEAHKPEAFYAAGYAEGAETADRISQNFMNIFPNAAGQSWSDQCPAACQTYIEKQREWMNTQSLEMMRTLASDTMEYKFWESVQHSVQQINGLIDGFHSVIDGNDDRFLTGLQVYLVGFDFELGDVMHWVNNQTNPVAPRETAVQRPRSGHNQHCSALIKVTDDDLYMAHDTWSGYNTMLRQYKTYQFGNSSIPTIAMSSYPGTLHSGDDWYMMSNGLTTQETTNGNFNNNSKPMITYKSVPEFVRVMVANRVATDGKSWAELFAMENSGTYNNQYMIVDHNKFNPKGKTAAEKTPAGTLWIIEQMPMLTKKQDVTSFLVKDSYWASYNIPYLLNKEMGYPQAVAEYGSFFNYTTYARPEIFRQNQGAIKDLDGMKQMMRWNEYKTSPLSVIPSDNCKKTPSHVCTPTHNPTLAIANRGDLAPVLTEATGGPLYHYLTQAAFGAIDSKIVSYKGMMEGMMGHMTSGPTALKYSGKDDLPAFQWSTSPFSGIANQHLGQPDRFDFDYYTSKELVGNKIYYKSVTPPPTDFNPKYHGKFAPYQGFMLGVLLASCVLAVYIFVSKKNADPEDSYNPMAN